MTIYCVQHRSYTQIPDCVSCRCRITPTDTTLTGFHTRITPKTCWISQTMHVLFSSEQMKQPQTWVFSSHTGYFLLDMEIFCQCCRGWWCKRGSRNLGASDPCVCPELMPCSMVLMDATYQTQGQRSNDQESQDGGSRVLNQAWRPGRLHRSPASKAGPAGEPWYTASTR